jgi:internalin A
VDAGPLSAYDHVSTPGLGVYSRGLTMSKVLPLLAGLLLAAPLLLADEAEDRAVEGVKKLGGTVERDDKSPAHPVVRVYLTGSSVGDASLKGLTKLVSLRTLGLTDTGVTDGGLKDLADLSNLEELNLGFTKVTDAGLKDLAKFKKLRTLSLFYTNVTDDGLADLANLKSLKSLDLLGTSVTDAGLKKLTALKGLQTLNLHNTRATDAGVADLQKALPDCRIIR